MLVTSLETPIDRLLEHSSHGHGFWLINHRQYIEQELKDALEILGFDETLRRLNTTGNIWVKKLYRDIEAGRQRDKPWERQ